MNDSSKTIKAYGTWPSNISADMVGAKTPKLAEPCINQKRLFWLQALPEEKGRLAVMMKHLDGAKGETQNEPVCILPRPLSAKSKVHEYGGGSYCVDGNTLFFVLADDQQIYCVDLAQANFEPRAVTNQTDNAQNAVFPVAENDQLRFADLYLDKYSNALIAVCEHHDAKHQHEPETRLVSISLQRKSNGHTINKPAIKIIASGNDFYSNPALSPCDQYLCWLSWDHPNMPWDATQLWICPRDQTGHFNKQNASVIVGDNNESIFQPRFAANGDLYFVSDKNDWWNLYRIQQDDLRNKKNAKPHPVFPLDAEFATPQWTFGMSTYCFLNADKILATFSQNGDWQLCEIDLSTNPATTESIDTGKLNLRSFHGLQGESDTAVFIASSPQSLANVFAYSEKTTTPLGATHNLISHNNISEPIAFTFPTGTPPSDSTKTPFAHGFYYAPTHSAYSDVNAKPPLIVICHGGPTGATETSLNLKIQYWTNRGFAVVDVNYRGSTGFGRSFRHSLHGQWGVYDVEDVCAAADYAVKKGWTDKEKLIIKGGSAGGYTVLAALAFTDRFSAGVSLYGIGDLETLVRDTHKFEARYLDKLVGRYPEEKELYAQRSPIHYANKINCPLLVFQGLEDKVVPPNQAETMVNAVRANGLNVEYVTFADEGHGFRNASNIKTMLDKELAFYKATFNLEDN